MGCREESCNSRHLSRLMKSCFPNPQTTVNTTTTTTKPKSISSLPDDLLIDILSRLPSSSLHSLSSVSHHWAHLLDSPSFLFLRRLRHSIHPTLFAFSPSLQISSLPFLLHTSSWHHNHPIAAIDISHARFASLGRRIYVITRSSSHIFDPWTASFRAGSPTLFPRKRFAAASVSGRIYVAGGSTRATAVEEYDPDKNEWRVASHAPRKRYGCLGVGVDGIFYIIGGLKIGGASVTRADMTVSRAEMSVPRAGIADPRADAGAEARVYASSMDLYDVKTRGWLRSRAVPGGGCVVAACGAHGHVYVLASHAVELSFWRFNAGRRKAGFGEWSRVKGPPLPAQVRLDGSVRFTCIGWEDKVVLIQVLGCIDDLLRRSGRNVRGYKEGLVLIFDCVSEEWSRGPDLPEFVQRPACICVEC